MYTEQQDKHNRRNEMVGRDQNTQHLGRERQKPVRIYHIRRKRHNRRVECLKSKRSFVL